MSRIPNLSLIPFIRPSEFQKLMTEKRLFLSVHLFFQWLYRHSAAVLLLTLPFTAHSQNYTASSDGSTSPITISSGNHTISVGSSGALTRSNAITLSGGTLQGGIMDNVATVSNLSGSGTASTYVDANGVTIILSGSGTTDTTADLTLAGGISITGANQLPELIVMGEVLPSEEAV